jgi:hypothetical protein
MAKLGFEAESHLKVLKSTGTSNLVSEKPLLLINFSINCPLWTIEKDDMYAS